MARWYNFSIATLAAHPARNERLNVAVVVFNGSGLDVRPAKNLDKVRAISAAIDSEILRSSLFRMEQTDRILSADGFVDDAERLANLRTLSPFELAPMGRFEAPSDSAYERSIAEILAKFVEPEPAPFKKSMRRSRLLSSIKAAFKDERVLARRGEDLSAHRVVSGWQLAEGLSADLVLQNGLMHVIETVDAQSDEITARKIIQDIAVSALVLEQARMTFGESGTNARLVYSASSMREAVVTPSLRAAEHQGAKLINWASHEDRRSFISEIAFLATPIERSNKGIRPLINSGTQGRFTLN
jgi:hypothetical protein